MNSIDIGYWWAGNTGLMLHIFKMESWNHIGCTANILNIVIKDTYFCIHQQNVRFSLMERRYHECQNWSYFLAATKQLYEWFSPSVRPSVRLSVCLSHLFDYVPIIISSWNFQELLPVTKVTSMQKVKVRGQRSRSQRSQPNLTVSGMCFQFEFTYDESNCKVTRL